MNLKGTPIFQDISHDSPSQSEIPLSHGDRIDSNYEVASIVNPIDPIAARDAYFPIF